MASAAYLHNAEERLRELDADIEKCRQMLDESPRDRQRVKLAGRLSVLERHREELLRRLDALKSEPDTLWNNVKAQVAEEWFDLVLNVEDRIASLR
jgi:hypothetical protein